MYIERNKEITIKVLEGMTCKAAGIEYGITTERVRQLIGKTCRQHFLPKTPPWRNSALDGVYKITTLRRLWKEDKIFCK